MRKPLNKSQEARPTGPGATQEVAPGTLQSLQRFTGNRGARLLLQSKLTVNTPGDRFEQEADRVADQVMRSELPGAVSAAAPVGSYLPASAPADSAAPPSVYTTLSLPGQPLDTATRAFLEPRFGRDFSAVRIHTGTQAEQSAQDVHARAYTVGSNVVFGASQFAPATTEGLRLLAHELTHVVQQSDSGSSNTTVVQRFDEGEHKSIGDVATGQRTVFLAPDMPVTFGDLVSLGGDYFGDWQTIVRLANTPGISKGTRGEVWYALLVKIRANLEGQDATRAEQQGLGRIFDQSAKEAVETRFKLLAVNNIPHFPNPVTGDEKLPQSVKDAGPGATGGGASYRAAHVQALTVAAAIGQAKHSTGPIQPRSSTTGHGDGLDGALIIEAFGDHFLTDSFSAGHQQTPRASVQAYWNAKVPTFWSQFKRWLAAELTLQLRRAPQSLTTKIGSHLNLTFVADEIALPQVEAAFEKMPRLGFGDLVSGALHDYFNTFGAVVDVGNQRITLVGDGRLLTGRGVGQGGLPKHVTDDGRDTFNAAAAAVQAGIAEIYAAADLGRQGIDPLEVPAKILQAGGGQFAAESLMPVLAPDQEVSDDRQKSINWALPDYPALFADPRIATGLSLALGKYADLVQENLGDLSTEQKAAVNEVLSVRMKGGPDSVVRLLRDVITFKPLITEGGFDPRLLDELRQGISDIKR